MIQVDSRYEMQHSKGRSEQKIYRFLGNHDAVMALFLKGFSIFFRYSHTTKEKNYEEMLSCSIL